MPRQFLHCLSGLTILYLSSNEIDDIRPVAALRNLDNFQINRSRVVDLSPLTNLTELQILQVRDSQVEDLSPLRNKPRLYPVFCVKIGILVASLA